MTALPSIVLYLIPACISAGLAIYGWQRRTAEARPFSLLMIAVAFWSLCHTFSVGSPTFAWALFWAQVQYAGIVAVGPSWLLFALAYAKRWDRATGLILVLLTVPPALAYLAVLTNGWHYLWWSRIELDPTRPFVALAVQRGVLFWLHVLYSYACVGLGLGFFIYAMREPRLLYRSQAEVVVLAALFPLVGNIAHLLGLQTRAVDDPTPFLFAASGALMFYATRQYQLLNLTPIAQQEIVDEMPDGLVVLDHRGLIAAANPAAARLLGVDVGAWLGRTMPELAGHSALAAALRPLLAQVASATSSLSSTVEYADGEHEYVVEGRLRPIQAARSRAGALLLLRDMTERAQIERQLDRQLAELTLISQIASLANAAAHTDGLLHAITGQIVEAMHWDRVTVGLLQPDGEALRIVVDEAPGDVESFAGVYMLAGDFGVIFEIVRERATRMLTADDPALRDTRTANALASLGLQTMLVVPLYQRDQPLGALAVGYVKAQAIHVENLRLYETIGRLVSDAITRARLYEAANEASTLKSAFLATVSHELRTPLTSIIGYADMLDQGVFGPLAERAIEPLDHIRRSGQMLLQLINDILDFSKLEAGHFSIDLYPVDVASVITSVAGALQPQIRASALTLELAIDADLPLVRANSGRLEQILTNLLANAVKFTERGFIRVGAEYRDERVRLTVQDTGIGIAPEQIERIFQPFHQVDNQLTRRFGGTGLGLAISQRLLGLMQGAIQVESALGQGSKFTIELPVAALGALQEREYLG